MLAKEWDRNDGQAFFAINRVHCTSIGPIAKSYNAHVELNTLASNPAL